MWALLSSRVRTWVLLAVLVPVAGSVARAIARRLEARNGPSRLTRALFSVGDMASRRKRAKRGTTSSSGKAEADRVR